MGRTVKTTIYPGQKPTEAQIKRIRKAATQPITFDEESPEYTLEELISMRDIAEKKRAEQKKEVVAIRLSPSTIKKAKSLGKGYTSFLSRLIENAINDKDIVSRSL